MTIYVLPAAARPRRRADATPTPVAADRRIRLTIETPGGSAPMLRTIGRAPLDRGPESAPTLAVGLGGTAAAPRRPTVKVEINDDGCPAKLTTKAGPTTFKVSNEGSGDVSEFEVLSGDRIIGEVENIAPGSTGSSRSR